MSDATQTQNQTLEQTLNKTDLGHVIYENRKIIFVFILAVLFFSTGYVLWKQMEKNNSLENSVKVFEFQSGIWADVKTGKTGIPELVSSFEALDSNIQSSSTMLPVILEISKFLYEKGNYTEADFILSKTGTSHKYPIFTFFVSMQRAVILEKLGKIDEAIAVIEPLAQSKEVLMPAKVSVELGRLYLLKGEKGKAQTQFDYVLSTFPNDEQAKLAKLYLSQIVK